MIEIEHVTKTHLRGTTKTEVLRDISCSIPRGAFSFIVGPSGSGKSTLLYLIGALDEPTSGEIRVEGQSLSQLSAGARDRLRRQEIGFVFQSFNLLPNLNAIDNVLVPFLPTGARIEKRPDAIELLKRVGLGARLEHRPSQLSGGEQQRVAIARAILKQPKLILADEPTGELDSKNGAEIFQLLRDLQAEHGSTIVTVTHDQRYIGEGDQVLEIQDGRIQSVQAPHGVA